MAKKTSKKTKKAAEPKTEVVVPLNKDQKAALAGLAALVNNAALNDKQTQRAVNLYNALEKSFTKQATADERAAAKLAKLEAKKAKLQAALKAVEEQLG